MKYTKEFLEPIVDRNVSVAAVARELGLKYTSGSCSHLRRAIDKAGLDTSHFTGQACNKGKASPTKKTPEEFLVLRRQDQPRLKGKRIKQSLFELGVPNRCSSCGLGPEWNGKSLTLVPDHKNGKFWDNRPDNLQLICPNCHSQTDTFSGKNNTGVVEQQTQHT